MNFPRVAVVQQTALLVVLPRWTDFMSTTVTQPPLLLNIQVQVFRDPYAALLFGCHRVPLGFVPTYCLFSFFLFSVQFRVSELVDHQRPTFRNEIRAVRAFEHRATLHAIPRPQQLPVIKLRGEVRRVKRNFMTGSCCGRGIAWRVARCSKARTARISFRKVGRWWSTNSETRN